MGRLLFTFAFGIFSFWNVATQAQNECEILLKSMSGISPEQFLQSAGIDLKTPLKKPIVLQLFDFDDNVAYLDGSSVYLAHKVTGKEFAITTKEYADHKEEIMNGVGRWADYEFFDFLHYPDGRVERVSLKKRYEVQAEIGKPGSPYEKVTIEEGSWKDFRDIPNPNALIERLAAVMKKDNRWIGPSWNNFAVALKDESDSQWVGILTSRGHEPATFIRAFELIQGQGLIHHLPRKELMFPIYSSNFPSSFGSRPQERKPAVLVALLDLLEKIPLANPGDHHRLVYSEDDQTALKASIALLNQHFAEGRWKNVQIDIVNTDLGNDSRTSIRAPKLIHSLPEEVSPVVAILRERVAAQEKPFKIFKNTAEEWMKEFKLTKEELMLHLIPVARHYASPQISGYHVGVVGEALSGNLYLGVNMEFPGLAIQQTIHGEQFLIGNLFLHHEYALKSIALSAAPCGHCRQFIWELEGAANIDVIISGQPTQKLAQYLHHAFEPQRNLQGSGNQWLGSSSRGLLNHENIDLTGLFEVSPLVEIALSAFRTSYSPHTRSPSGVAIEMKDRRVYKGASLSALQVALIGLRLYQESPADIQRVVMFEVEGASQSSYQVDLALAKSLNPSVDFKRFKIKREHLIFPE
jgi:cytidine deaminase